MEDDKQEGQWVGIEPTGSPLSPPPSLNYLIALSVTHSVGIFTNTLTRPLLCGQVIDSEDMSSWQQQQLVGPRCPVWNHRQPIRTLHHHTDLRGETHI